MTQLTTIHPTAMFTLPKPTGFRLSAACELYASFTPGSGMAAASTARDLVLSFRLDGTFAPVVASLREEGDVLAVKVAGTHDVRAVTKQLGRVIGLDADADAWRALGEKDVLVGKLQAAFPGFFTAAKSSPYDAAAWSIIAPRMSMKQAAKIKMRLAEELGDTVVLDGTAHAIFPSPGQLAQLEAFPGLSEEKVVRLVAVAEAAKRGLLDAERLREIPEEQALDELQSIRGIGPWSAGHIYYRGAAPHDALATVEPRVLHAYANTAGVAVPSEAQFRDAAEAWRPFRMWVSILLMRELARSGEWSAPGLAKERAEAGRQLVLRVASNKAS